MVMLLYHATQDELPLSIGCKLEARVRDLAGFPDYRRIAEELLDQRRPPEEKPHQRLSSWFACDTPALAALYLEGEERRRELMHGPRPWRPHLYTVKMERFSKQPMRLAEAVATKLSEGKDGIAETLAKEYWAPRPEWEWKFWEYISPEIEVMAHVPWPITMDRAVAGANYDKDGDTLKRFVQVLESSTSPEGSGR
jgi:hypothetical protein